MYDQKIQSHTADQPMAPKLILMGRHNTCTVAARDPVHQPPLASGYINHANITARQNSDKSSEEIHSIGRNMSGILLRRLAMNRHEQDRGAPGSKLSGTILQC